MSKSKLSKRLVVAASVVVIGAATLTIGCVSSKSMKSVLSNQNIA